MILPTLGQGGVFALGAGSFAIAAAAVALLGVESKASHSRNLIVRRLGVACVGQSRPFANTLVGSCSL